MTDNVLRAQVIPVAFPDPPLLNVAGVHEPAALRSIIVVTTSNGLTGLGESYGQATHIDALRELADRLIGQPAHDLTRLRRVAHEVALNRVGPKRRFEPRGIADFTARLFGAFEVAFLDVCAQEAGLPLADYLGGRAREVVPVAGYLFYKWAGHPGEAPDDFGAATDAEGIVRQAGAFIDRYGFGSLKLKGGVARPEEELDAIRALHEAFPGVPLRWDPNTAWTTPTAIRTARAAEGLLDYLEDPTPGIEGMAEVRRNTDIPLATNMCVTELADLPTAVAAGAVDIVLGDHHYWGGLTGSRDLAAICRTWGLGMSMHSNSHLGISLAAMVHLAAVLENTDHALDTHTPWQAGVDVVSEPLPIVDGGVAVPTAPGLGVHLDQDRVDELHEAYLRAGMERRDDTGYMQRFVPDFTAKLPRW